MAIKKPLVLTNGKIEEVQTGDSIDTQAELYQASNDNAGTITIGQAVYVSGAGSVDLARANAGGTVPTIGLVGEATIGAGSSGSIQTDGIVTATALQWDALTGDTGGLVAGACYFLSDATAGSITQTSPSASGSYSQVVGIALSSTELLVEPMQSIKLA